MRFCVATILCVATLVVSGSAAVDKKKADKAKKKNLHDLRTGKRTTRHNNAADSVEDKVLAAEDEGYWERFLQNQEDSSITPPPTPSPTNPPGFCDTRVRRQDLIEMVYGIA